MDNYTKELWKTTAKMFLGMFLFWVMVALASPFVVKYYNKYYIWINSEPVEKVKYEKEN